MVDEVRRFLSDEELEWKRTDGVSDAEEIIELAGRLCYLSFGDRQSPRKTDEYIQNLIKMAHESVLEHATWTFILTGVSRAFTHQLVRHRIGFSYSQLSQQYVDQAEGVAVIPSLVANNPSTRRVWEDVVDRAFAMYNEVSAMLTSADIGAEGHRAIRSAARSLLPEATATKIAITTNGRSLRHFLRLRGGIEGDEEMRRVSALVFEMLVADAPSLCSDFTLDVMRDGSPIVRHRT